FSAPIKWETDTTFAEKLLILEFETDYFTIYDTIKDIYKKIICKRIYEEPDINIENKLITTLRSIIRNNKSINLSLLSEILSIPTFSEIESEIKKVDPLKIYKTIDDLNYLFGTKLKVELLNKLKEIDKNITKIWPEGKDERKLIETIWRLLLHSKYEGIKNKVISYVDSNSMTLSKAALNVFTRINCPERELISNIFFNKWKHNPVVLDNWFFFKASIEINNNQKNIEALFKNEYFDVKSPNTLRSILNAYVTRNSLFHSTDGSGYKYIADKILEYDKSNPIVISRFLKIFSTFSKYENPYKRNIVKVLDYIKKNNLSPNTREVIDAILN
ncbi:aminopeptidase N C-terminal domain-containing protein, partial [Prochlorococcus sp. AH-716-I19]|nr:aminopeptidase N C-terminal domain-containing protein [Prochlorococcus sp. AH-716-I19]